MFNSKSKPHMADLQLQITNLGGKVPPRPRILLGRNLKGYIATLESTLAGLTSGAPTAPVAAKTSPTVSKPAEAKVAAKTDTLESLIAQHSALEERIEAIDKTPPPSPAASSGQVFASSIKKASGKSLMELGIATYGQAAVDGMLRSAGPEGVEHSLMRSFFLDSLSGQIPSFPDSYYQTLYGAPPAPFGLTRFEQRTKMDRLVIALNA